MKRAFDIIVSLSVLIVFSPFISLALFLIWLEDKQSPIYQAPRVGLNGSPFTMYKMRTMVVDADKSGVDSTSVGDPRITRSGALIRKLKLDETLQFVNVLIGSMSVVGPRPNVQSEVSLYSKEEALILTSQPGITDFSSVVFSDLGEILEHSADPNLSYNQLVRPWKSRFALAYVKHQSFMVDISICLATAVSIFSRKYALRIITSSLIRLSVSEDLIEVSKRRAPLVPSIPPGFDTIVTMR